MFCFKTGFDMLPMLICHYIWKALFVIYLMDIADVNFDTDVGLYVGVNF